MNLIKSIAADVLLFTALLLAGFTAGLFYESSRAAHAAQAELRDLQQRQARTVAWLRGERVQSESRLQRHISQLATQLSTDQGKANEEHHTHVAGLRAGTVSVRVPIVPASCQPAGSAAAPHAGAEPAAPHAQLDPAAAATLAAIPHEGDAAIRDLNACIAQYNAVKDSLDQWLAQMTQHAEASHAQTP